MAFYERSVLIYKASHRLKGKSIFTVVTTGLAFQMTRSSQLIFLKVVLLPKELSTDMCTKEHLKSENNSVR